MVNGGVVDVDGMNSGAGNGAAGVEYRLLKCEEMEEFGDEVNSNGGVLSTVCRWCCAGTEVG